jgi:phosphoglycolate phosphatase
MAKEQKKACIFDLDGTLVNSLSSIAYFANEALIRSGYRALPVDTYRYLAGNGADALMRGMLKASGDPDYTEEDVRFLRQIYDQLYEGAPLCNLQEYPGVKDMVKGLRAMGLRLAVLSNKPHNVTEEIIRLFFPEGTFDIVFGQREGFPRKPAPDGALLIAETLGVQPSECLYIGDTDVDMKTGSAAGMETVGVLWGFRDREELEQNHAGYIASSPEELLAWVEAGDGSEGQSNEINV